MLSHASKGSSLLTLEDENSKVCLIAFEECSDLVSSSGESNKFVKFYFEQHVLG